MSRINPELCKMKDCIEKLTAPTLLKDVVKLIQSENVNLSENYIRTTTCLWESLGLIKNVAISKERRVVNSKFREVYKVLFTGGNDINDSDPIEYLDDITNEKVQRLCFTWYNVDVSRNYISSILSSLHLFGVLEIDHINKNGPETMYQVKDVPDSILAKINGSLISKEKQEQLQQEFLQTQTQTSFQEVENNNMFDPNNLTPEQIGVAIITGNRAIVNEIERIKKENQNLVKVLEDKINRIKHLENEIKNMINPIKPTIDPVKLGDFLPPIQNEK